MEVCELPELCGPAIVAFVAPVFEIYGDGALTESFAALVEEAVAAMVDDGTSKGTT
ncbi:MAG TPA: hypothetical protein VGC11_03010 [Acidimicrobiia bacterium]|jgi:hypothetical protein